MYLKMFLMATILALTHFILPTPGYTGTCKSGTAWCECRCNQFYPNGQHYQYLYHGGIGTRDFDTECGNWYCGYCRPEHSDGMNHPGGLCRETYSKSCRDWCNSQKPSHSPQLLTITDVRAKWRDRTSDWMGAK